MVDNKNKKRESMSSRFAVVTLDLIGSRDIDTLSTKIKNLLHEINRRYHAQLIAPFVVTLGDEFQGVLRSTSEVFHIFIDVQSVFEIYAGVGTGKIDRSQDTYSPSMTGEAFVRSREAIHSAKDRRRTFVVSTGEVELDLVVNTLAYAAQFIRSEQTARQKSVIDSLLLDSNLKKSRLATKLKVSPQAISRILKGGGFYTTQEITTTIQHILSVHDSMS